MKIPKIKLKQNWFCKLVSLLFNRLKKFDEIHVKSDSFFPNFNAFDLIIINSPNRHLIGRLDKDSIYPLFYFKWVLDLIEKRFKLNVYIELTQFECFSGAVKLANEEDEEVTVLKKEQFNYSNILY